MLDRPGTRWAIVGVSVAAALVVLLWAAAQLGWSFTDGADPADDANAADAFVVGDGVVVALEPRTYGLGAADRSSVRIEASLVIAEDADVELVARRQALFDDVMVVSLANLSRDEITGPDGTERLRQELLIAARIAYPELDVQQVLITGLLAG